MEREGSRDATTRMDVLPRAARGRTGAGPAAGRHRAFPPAPDLPGTVVSKPAGSRPVATAGPVSVRPDQLQGRGRRRPRCRPKPKSAYTPVAYRGRGPRGHATPPTGRSRSCATGHVPDAELRRRAITAACSTGSATGRRCGTGAACRRSTSRRSRPGSRVPRSRVVRRVRAGGIAVETAVAGRQAGPEPGSGRLGRAAARPDVEEDRRRELLARGRPDGDADDADEHPVELAAEVTG